MQSEYKAILLEKKKGVATITLNQPENLNLMTEHFAYNVCRQTKDHEEAIRAFLDKRPAVFKGK